MTDAAPMPSYRWIIVFASALILAISMGAIVNGFSAYIVPMQNAHDWQRGEVALINFSGIIGLAFGGLVMGPLADKHGTRPVVLFGAIVLGLCYVAASYASTLWQYYALFFVAGFFGAGAIFPPIMAAVGNWFLLGAGLAIGIASAGQALGQGGVPFASSFLIESYGIDRALLMTGIFMLATLVPLALLLRQPPQASAARGQTATGDDENYLPLKTVVTYMSAAIILCCTCMSVPLMHLVPLIQDRGFAPEEASSVIFVMLLVAISGRIAFGKLSDIIGALPAYMTATAWMTVMIFGFIYMTSLQSFYIYAIVYGFGYAGVMTGVLVTIRALIHPSKRGSAMGFVNMFGWFGHAIGGTMGGVFFDYFGDYSAAYGVAAVAGVVNLIIVFNLYRKTQRPKRLMLQPA